MLTIHVTIALVTILPSPAFAQGSRPSDAEQAPSEGPNEGPNEGPSEEDLARARALFLQGVEFSDGGRWEAAAASFERALALRAAPAIEYNLASALIELGQFQRADRLLRGVLEHPEASEDLRRSAINARGDVRARAAELRFSRFGGGTVRVGGEAVAADEAVRPYFVVPGEHQVELVRGGSVTERREVEVVAASVTEVEFTSAEVAVAVSDPPETRPIDPTVAFLVVGSVLTVVAVTAVIAFASSDGAQGFDGLGPELGGAPQGAVFEF